MKRISLLLLAALLTAACVPSDREQVPSGTISDKSSDPSENTVETPSEEPSEEPSAEPLQREFEGWRCQIYSNNKLAFDQEISFAYDSKGRICSYDEHQISYENDGVTPWSDDNYKRIYLYTSDTHIDFYNDFIEGNEPSTWYDLDDEGRFKEVNNLYGPNYLYRYDEDGHLVEIVNKWQYEDEEDEEKYDSWKKSTCITWVSGNPCRIFQKWVNPDTEEQVIRSAFTIMTDQTYFNPFRYMVLDPSVSGTEMYSIIGLTGTRSRNLIAGWYLEADPTVRTEVNLILNRERKISGLVVIGKNHGLDSMREYTFSWAIDPPTLETDHVIVN